MRTLALVAIAVALVGCNPDVPLPEGAQTSSLLVHPTPDPPNSLCTWVGAGAQPLQDLWKGQRGYIVYHRLYTYCDDTASGNYGVIGLDPTMTQIIFQTEVADMNGVSYYQHLPGTIPFHCQYQIDCGQVGTQNTDTGGGHWCPDGPCPCMDRLCVPNDQLAGLKGSCTPCKPLSQAQACANAGASCGIVSDGCANPLSCGTCGVGFTCDAGFCSRQCPVRRCPRGSYMDPDTCACQSGLPQ
jgi:hypothetical protein